MTQIINQTIYEKISNIIASGETSWIITILYVDNINLKIGTKIIIKKNGEFIGHIGDKIIEKAILKHIMEYQYINSITLTIDKDHNIEISPVIDHINYKMQKMTLLVEPLFYNDILYIIGGGHCGKSLAELMVNCNFTVNVIDCRTEWIMQSKYPTEVKIIKANYNELDKYMLFTSNTFIVIMTHSHTLDQIIAKTIINKKYKYLGIIGSNIKAKKMLNTLKNYTDVPTINKIFLPIGLNIKSQTPYEIAISIAAQILAVKNDVQHIHFNSNPILNNFE